ncbi:hypothetical protein RI367_005038 [Sorochytrium milnesiophthora]
MILPLLVALAVLCGTSASVRFPGTASCQHAYEMTVLSRTPFIAYVRNFLQPGEAEAVISLTNGRMSRSSVTSPDGTGDQSAFRTSFSTYLGAAETPEVACIEQRAARLLGLESIMFVETLQVVWYRKGQEFQPHYDWFGEESLPYLMPGGQRLATILVYLNGGKDLQGGATVFPKLTALPHLCGIYLDCDNSTSREPGLRVIPSEGDAVFWYNIATNAPKMVQQDMMDKYVGQPLQYSGGDLLTLHGGEPVNQGQKYAINIWARERPTRV